MLRDPNAHQVSGEDIHPLLEAASRLLAAEAGRTGYLPDAAGIERAATNAIKLYEALFSKL